MAGPGSPALLYEHGWPRPWVRLLCLAVGAAMLLVAGHLTVDRLFGVQFLLNGPVSTPVGFLPAVLAPLLLGLAFCWSAVARRRVYWDGAGQALLVETRGLLGTARVRVPGPDIVAIRVRHGLAGDFRDILAADRSGGARWLVRIHDRDATRVGGRIAAAVGKPLVVA